jgi:murein DD-endopeptidase MepM/ murein hydrolase activator NlpD
VVTARCMPSASSDPTTIPHPRAEEPGSGRQPRTRGHCRALASLLAGAITLLAAPAPLAASLTPVERGWARGVFPVVSFAGFTSGFGMRLHPLSGSLRSHDGIDIAAPLGSPVRSWWTGRVQEVVLDGGCGNGLVIRSGAYEHIYCHLGGTVVNGTYSSGAVRLRLGSRVAAGQLIGHVGVSGTSTGPHLHWGLRYRGSWLDPARVLRAMAASRNNAPPALTRRPNVGLFR